MDLLLPFGLALFVALFGSGMLPGIHLVAFAPFLAIVYQRRTLVGSLWIALGCGLIMDVLCSQARFGLFVVNFLGTTLLLHRQKRHFFDDRSATLPIFTYFISSISTLLQFVLLTLVDTNPPFSWGLICTDCVIMPLFDALYAAVWFIGPMKLAQFVQKHGVKQLFLKEDG